MYTCGVVVNYNPNFCHTDIGLLIVRLFYKY